MATKLPYYMAYPMPFIFDDERREEWDYDYMKSMYPQLAKRIFPYVEEECDRMEYEGSMIYDEYPDKLQLRLMCRRVYHKVKAEEKMDDDATVQEMAELMLYQELWKRRCMHRRKYQRTHFFVE